MKIKLAISFLVLFFTINFCAVSQTSEKKSISKGTPYVKVFSNFHIDVNTQETTYQFELTRAYFGYKFSINENYTGNVCIDFGNPKNGSSYEQVAYLKYAALVYDKNKWNIAGGIIGLDQFRTQEKFWGYRYIYKSFLDKHKMGHSADLGATVKYKLSKTFRLDATLRNGEGYKKQASDNTLRFGSGFLYEPNKSFSLRGYYDVYEKGVVQSTISLFAGYRFTKKYRLGVEYNYVSNDSWNSTLNKSGISIYTTYKFSKKLEIFGRFDQLASNVLSENTESWNINKDGKAIICGVQYRPNNNVKFSLNHQGWMSNISNSDYQKLVYLSVECRF